MQNTWKESICRQRKELASILREPLERLVQRRYWLTTARGRWRSARINS